MPKPENPRVSAFGFRICFGADGLLEHLKNVTPVLDEFLPLVEVVRCEVHGPAAELEKLKGPLAALNPAYFAFVTGVKRK